MAVCGQVRPQIVSLPRPHQIPSGCVPVAPHGRRSPCELAASLTLRSAACNHGRSRTCRAAGEGSLTLLQDVGGRRRHAAGARRFATRAGTYDTAQSWASASPLLQDTSCRRSVGWAGLGAHRGGMGVERVDFAKGRWRASSLGPASCRAHAPTHRLWSFSLS